MFHFSMSLSIVETVSIAFTRDSDLCVNSVNKSNNAFGDDGPGDFSKEEEDILRSRIQSELQLHPKRFASPRCVASCQCDRPQVARGHLSVGVMSDRRRRRREKHGLSFLLWMWSGRASLDGEMSVHRESGRREGREQ